MDDTVVLIGKLDSLMQDPMALYIAKLDGDIRLMQEVVLHETSPYPAIKMWIAANDIKGCHLGFKSYLNCETWLTCVIWLISFDNKEEKTLFLLSKDQIVRDPVCH